jgi:hypothetical protein
MLYVYDLSQGFAAQVSQAMLGKQVRERLPEPSSAYTRGLCVKNVAIPTLSKAAIPSNILQYS